MSDDVDPDELLRVAASAEQGSEHPLGRAIAEAAKIESWTWRQPVIFGHYPGSECP